MTRARSGFQVTIDDLIFETEVIKGAIPAGADEASEARDLFYRGIAAGVTASCVPDQKIHVFDIGATRCACAAKKEDS